MTELPQPTWLPPETAPSSSSGPDGVVGWAPPAAGVAVLTRAEPVVDAAITIKGLTKRFGDLFAVRDLSLDIPRGSVFGLIGPNGAGKSTTFAVLATLLIPNSGTVRIAGFDPIAQPRDVRRVIGYMPDTMGVYDSLRVDEYLRFFANSYKISAKRIPDLITELLELVDLSVKRTSMVDSLSRGMKQRLSLARALVHDPEVLILDEPASGLDPRARVELRDLISGLRGMGKTIVVSSHILAELEEMCTDIAILEAGELRAIGTPASLVSGLAGSRGSRQVLVRMLDGTEEAFTVADETEQVALLRRLVEEGRPIVEFSTQRGNLESAFMELTEGIVQ
jgi:ABC-2 type transport system ATP-binding protein